LDRAQGELDAAERPIRAAVLAHFPGEVAELFERPAHGERHAAGTAEARSDAAADTRPEPTVTAPG
jgi:hypothetical protein